MAFFVMGKCGFLADGMTILNGYKKKVATLGGMKFAEHVVFLKLALVLHGYC